MPSLEADKKRLRDSMKRTSPSISKSRARDVGERIAAHITDWHGWQASPAIVLFSPLADEVDPSPLAAAASRDGKRLLLPRMIPGKSLEFAALSNFESLVAGRYGVLEPDVRFPAEVLGTDFIVFVPGLAFDQSGGRLGRGAGYYDRALAGWRERETRPRFIGIAFAHQIVASVPINKADVLMDGIATEMGFLEKQVDGTTS